jgi:hypothetical protein
MTVEPCCRQATRDEPSITLSSIDPCTWWTIDHYFVNWPLLLMNPHSFISWPLLSSGTRDEPSLYRQLTPVVVRYTWWTLTMSSVDPCCRQATRDELSLCRQLTPVVVRYTWWTLTLSSVDPLLSLIRLYVKNALFRARVPCWDVSKFSSLHFERWWRFTCMSEARRIRPIMRLYCFTKTLQVSQIGFYERVRGLSLWLYMIVYIFAKKEV